MIKPLNPFGRPERWIHESDLTEEELARAAFHAIDKWLDEDVMGFESDEG